MGDERASRPLSDRSTLGGRALRAFLAQIPENSPVAMVAYDLGGRITYVNPWALALYGYEPHDLLGRPHEILFPPDELPRRAEVQREVEAHGFWRGEDQRQRRSGTVFPSSTSITAVRDDEGGVVAFSDVSRDISERRAMEQALRTSETRFRAILDAVSDGLFVLDGQGCILQANRAGLEMFGADAAHVLGHPGVRLIQPELRERFLSDWRRVADGESVTIETRAIHGAGRTIDMEVRGFPFQHGETPLVLAVARDVTVRLEMERELTRLATTDPLTGAANRRVFMETGAEEVYRARRYARDLSVAMLDADHFKHVNDRFGHAAGDAVLVELVRRCQAVLRESDIFARLGGEEFAVIMPETASRVAREVAQRLQAAIGACEIPTDRGGVRVTASLGVATLCPTDSDIEDVLKRADAALYRAKDAGRDRVVVA